MNTTDFEKKKNKLVIIPCRYLIISYQFRENIMRNTLVVAMVWGRGWGGVWPAASMFAGGGGGGGGGCDRNRNICLCIN